MADSKSEKSGHPVHEAGTRSNTDRPETFNPHQLAEMLNAHARAIGAAVGAAIGEKFAELQRELAQGNHELAQGKRELAHARHEEHEAEDAWLERCAPGDREPIKKLDHELHELEQALAGPEELLESEDGSNQPRAKGGEAVWTLPKYEPVKRDHDSA